ncbi:MAG: hypothetical protein DYG93_13595 [Leptolyngbya sp. PLA2]|nr:hypothetical protein [Leptolyngbya sp.]MCE7972681.1 hypothetical protein [Leptolyngbya sp. PL-A2]MCQ3939546.1 hypothetical protein [cyanobacterium CYA1]MCZ7632198.1 hypothetical protein [Phycisphaerales bacterium]MDL1903802.1 hypothetical protein [Synechococcales cyanobacterium CNB]GIK18530.1 MAG: hypothetical protein BroJett004_06940 [Planctomycetota bacterium]
MGRRPGQTAASRRLLPITIAALVVLALVPVRFMAFAGWFADLTAVVAAPVSQPLRALAAWVAPARTGGSPTEEIAELEQQRDHYATLYHRVRDENARLRELVRQLQGGIALNPELPLRLYTASVVGASSDLSSPLLTVRAGRRHGVERNTVATVAGVQLLGRVDRAAERLCYVRPITAPEAGSIIGTVMVSDEGGLLCRLAPVGDGTLRGDVEYPASPEGRPTPEVAPGQLVRLSDPVWPPSAQMLIIGQVERVEPAPDAPLRRVITVRPTVRLERVSEVVLRILQETGEGGGGP